MIARPEFVKDEHLEYLDELRESGITNMWGAVPYLLEEFGDISDKVAGEIHSYWMKSLSDRRQKGGM